MSKQVFDSSLEVLGLPNRAAFDAMIELIPEVLPFKEEMVEVMESIDPTDLTQFIDATHPTNLALAFQKIRTD